MKALKENWLLYLILIVGIAIVYLKPDNSAIKTEQRNYDKKLDSITTLVAKREAIENRTINNVTNLIQANNEKVNYIYSINDSLKKHLSDSILANRHKSKILLHK